MQNSAKGAHATGNSAACCRSAFLFCTGLVSCLTQGVLALAAPAGPAPQGSCGINVAASCGLPSSVIARAAEVALKQEELPGGNNAACAVAGAAAGVAGRAARTPLRPLNEASLGQPATKRQRGMGAQQAELRVRPLQTPSATSKAAEWQAALAAVQAAARAVLAGAPGAAEQLLRLHAKVAATLVTREL